MNKYLSNMFPVAVIGMVIVLIPSCMGGNGDVENDRNADSVVIDSIGLEELELFDEATIPKSADELFDDFLYSYISNNDFRRARTVRGIEQLMMDDDMPVVVIYDREEDLMLMKDTAVAHVVMEQIEWDENLIRRYEFDRNDDVWMLTAVSDDDVSNTPNASFLVFLHDFLADSAYRNESVRLPLTVSYYSEEEEEVVEEELSFDEWTELFEDFPDLTHQMMNVDYGQPLFSENRKSMQLQGLSSGLFLKFHFDFTDSRWCLIGIGS